MSNWFIGNALILPSLFCLEDLAARALLKDFFPVSPQSSVFIRSCCTPWSPPKSHSPNECRLLFLIRDVLLYQICLQVEYWMEPRRSYPHISRQSILCKSELNKRQKAFAFLTVKVKLKAWRRSSFKWWCSGWCAARGTPRQALLAT